MPTQAEIDAATEAMMDPRERFFPWRDMAAAALAAAESVRNRVRDNIITSAELEDAMTASHRPVRHPTQEEANIAANAMHKVSSDGLTMDECIGLAWVALDVVESRRRATASTADRQANGPCLRHPVNGTEYTWICDRCLKTWVDIRNTTWRPYVCRLNGTPDADAPRLDIIDGTKAGGVRLTEAELRAMRQTSATDGTG
jgi:hypothetical protein